MSFATFLRLPLLILLLMLLMLLMLFLLLFPSVLFTLSLFLPELF